MRKLTGLAVAAGVTLAVAAPADAARTYVVLYAPHHSRAEALRAIHRAGGRVVRENRRIGLATVAARTPRFLARAAHAAALSGAAANRAIGRVPGTPEWLAPQSEGPATAPPLSA